MGWFTEQHEHFGLKIRVTKKLFESKNLQHIQIYETSGFGKMLVLDGAIQLTEEDETFYHEMLVHVPMLTHKNPKKVLVIGGGDGGCVREVLKHEPDEVVMVEIDKDVINACRKFIGIDKGALNDSRVSIINEDGIAFVKNTSERFDVLIVDGTDPNPVSKSLVEKSFYEACSKITEVFNTQSQSPFIQKDFFRDIYRNMVGFREKRVYLSYVPTYPLGLWSFIVAANSKLTLDLHAIKQRFGERRIETKHYTPELHIASFTVPRWVEKIVKELD
ncbi:spermidine synthase [Archaeoglobales archaeon]|nr:MAG: spermidine synthase [Archaeoglobales archaeon]